MPEREGEVERRREPGRESKVREGKIKKGGGRKK